MRKLLSAYLFSIIAFVFFIVIGIIFILFRNTNLASTYFSIVSIVIILIGMFKLVLLDKDRLERQEYFFDLTEGIMDLVVGVVFANFYSFFFVDMIIFVGFISIPICRCFYSSHHLNQIFIDSPKFILSISLIFASNFTFQIFFMIMGIIFMCIGFAILGYKIFKELKTNKEKKLNEKEQV